MLPLDAGKHPVRPGPSRGVAGLCAAVCPRYGTLARREIRGHVCQSLHRGLRGSGAQSGAKAARHGLRGRVDPAPRYGRVCAVKTILIFLSMAGLVFSQDPNGDTKQRVKTVHELAKQGADQIPRIAPYISDPDLSVRIEAVKAVMEIGGPKTLDP